MVVCAPGRPMTLFSSKRSTRNALLRSSTTASSQECTPWAGSSIPTSCVSSVVWKPFLRFASGPDSVSVNPPHNRSDVLEMHTRQRLPLGLRASDRRNWQCQESVSF